MSRLLKFLKAESGATAIEYALMASAIGAVIVAIVFALGGHVGDLFQRVMDALGG